jgi:fructose-1,6-bisphosphatase II
VGPGEQVGEGAGPEVDVAVDPVDGTTLLANGMPNAIAAGRGGRGSRYDPSAVFYMDKLVCAGAVAGAVDIDAPVEHNVKAVARAIGGKPPDVTVSVLNRPRHQQLIADIRAAGARIKLFSDGNVAVAIAAASEGTSTDLLLGVGGTREGIITACAMKAMGGVIQARLAPRDDAERQKALDAGHNLQRVLHTDDLFTGTTRSSWPPESPTGSCCPGCATPPRARRPSRS